MVTFADLFMQKYPTAAETAAKAAAGVSSYTGTAPATDPFYAEALKTGSFPGAPEGNFNPPAPDYTQPQYINPLTAEQIRSRLFAPTGGNVTQDLVDLYDSQWVANPNPTGANNRWVQKEGYSGEFGSFPAQYAPANTGVAAGQSGVFTNPNTVSTPYTPGANWAQIAAPETGAGAGTGTGNSSTGAAGNPINLSSVSAMNATPYWNMLQPTTRPATARGVPTSNIYGAQLGATNPAGYQSYLDTFYSILNAPKQMPNFAFTPAPTTAEAAANSVAAGVTPGPADPNAPDPYNGD